MILYGSLFVKRKFILNKNCTFDIDKPFLSVYDRTQSIVFLYEFRYIRVLKKPKSRSSHSEGEDKYMAENSNLNFDEIIDRKNTNSLKYDFAKERGRDEDILPLWVADMDFRTAQPILDALHKTVEHGIFGYSEAKEPYFNALCGWFLKYYNWNIEQKWVTKTPGIVYAIGVAIQSFTKEGDAVLIQQPVYYPFAETITANNRKLVNNQLHYENGVYTIDFEDFEQKIVDNNVKLFLLCSPHNPVGRVWRRKELLKLGEICLKHNVLVVSDEIHCDFTYEGHPHIPFASLSDAFAENSITCTAPTKTFNLAGLQISNILIPNPAIRRKFRDGLDATGYSQCNVMGLVACQAAYEKGEEWYLALKKYLAENLDYARTFIRTRLPKIKLIEPEGTYLIWLDCSGLGLNVRELEDLVAKKAKLWLDGGFIFGKESEQFQRINIACPRSTLQRALEQLESAVLRL